MSPILDLDERRDAKALLLGHIRLGTFNGKHPEQSEGFIFTSADPSRLKPLAVDFGGEVKSYKPQGAGEEPWRVISGADAFTAVLPFPDRERNLDQWRVLWQRSGLKRRCDGATCSLIHVDEETGEITEKVGACICAATGNLECATETRLYLLLPQAGLGLWQLTTHSKFAASYLHAQLGFFEAVAPGRMNHLPIRVVYAPREIHFFDAKEGKRRSTTKRIVSVSVAGDAEHALRALALEPDRAFIAAVSAALEDAGRELAGISVAPALPAGALSQNVAPQVSQTDASATEPAPVSQNSGEAETLAAEVPEQGEGGPPPSAGDEPATNEQWTAMLRHVAKSTAAVFRKAHKRFPDAGLTQALDITRGQAEILIGEALK